MKLTLCRLKQVLSKGSFIHHVILLSGSTLVAQALNALTAPILSRLYTPEEYGISAVYISIVSLLSSVTSLRYELAILLPESEVVAANLLALSLILVFSTSLVFGIAIWLTGKFFVQLFNIAILQPYLWLLPLSIFGVGTYQTLNHWVVRQKRFAYIAQTKVTQILGQLFTQLGLGCLKFSTLGLLLGYVVGQVSGSSKLGKIALQENFQILRCVSIKGICLSANRYRKFPLISTISTLLNRAGFNLPTLLLTILYGPQVAGLFSLGKRLVGIPTTLVSQSVSTVYTKEASQLVNEKPQKLKVLFLKTTQKLFLLGIIPFGILALGGPWIFSIVFGDTWNDAGIFIQIMSPMLLMQFIVSPLSQSLNLLERQDLQLIWDILRLTIVIGCLLIPKQLQLSAQVSIALYSAGMSISYIALFTLNAYQIQKRCLLK